MADTVFDDKPDHERIRWAAEMAAIHDDIEQMPMAYRSLVGDMGTTLSGGQQQRVMLARALYRKPKLLVMDEGTSQLDVATERRVNAALKELKITRIAAAHRPETLAAADRIIGLEGGQLKELQHPQEPQAQVAQVQEQLPSAPNTPVNTGDISLARSIYDIAAEAFHAQISISKDTA